MYGVRRISKESYSFISQLAHCECGNAAVYARLVVVVRLYIHTNSRWFLFFFPENVLLFPKPVSYHSVRQICKWDDG